MKRPILWIFLLCAGTVALPYLANSPSNLDKILENQQERVSTDPRDPAAWNDLGNLLVLEDRFSEAEQAYRQSLALAPDDTSVRFNLALLLQQDGRSEETESELRQILQLDPRHAWAHYQVGVLMAARKNRSEALDHYARALAYDPQLSFSQNNPHILENPLFSEALLRSQKYISSTATRVPRQYSEPDRIVNLMLKEEAIAEEDAEDEENGEIGENGGGGGIGGSRASYGDDDDDDGGTPTAGRPVGGGLRGNPSNDARALQGTTVGSPTAQGSSSVLNRRQVVEQDRAEREARENRQPPATRPQGQPSLRRTPPVRTPDSAQAPNARTPNARTPNARTPNARTPTAEAPTTQAPAASDRRPSRGRGGGSRYIPGSSSTSRLELKLLPEEAPTRYASLDPNPGR